MHSYIGIHQFTPQAKFKSLETLEPVVDKIMRDQNAEASLGADNLSTFRNSVMVCVEVYYKLLGVNEEVIASDGKVEPRGILPRYTESLIEYFQNLERYHPNNREIKTLEYSGVTTIKIRYKYTDSVIKKLVKLGLRDTTIFREPLKIFLKGGALHDLIGMLFICSNPYEKEWVARAMYNFFEYEYRADDHLVYGFHTVQRGSGYRGLHCDHTLFDPRFDMQFSEKIEPLPFNSEKIFTLLDEKDEEISVLHKLKSYFNIEIQLHTVFENLWASMEHRNSYNIQAKGVGRNAEITAQWKFLSDNMKNLEMQFERLQIDTEQAQFKDPHREGYEFIKYLFESFGEDNSQVYEIYRGMVKRIENLEDLFDAREISRQDYVEQMLAETKYIDGFIVKQSDPTIQVLFKLSVAYIHYGLANHRSFFNEYDLHRFVQESMKHYKNIHDFIGMNKNIFKGKLLDVIVLVRYLQLTQKYGYGLIDLKDVTLTYNTTPIVTYEIGLSYFELAISLLNRLSEEDLEPLRYDNSAYIKVIHRFDVLAQEWELFKTDADTEQGRKIEKEIETFRAKFIKPSLLRQLETLLETNKMTNVGFVVRFYSLMVWHNICQPVDALKQIVKYSAYDRIKTSDILYYDLSAYKYLVVNRCEKMSDCKKDIQFRNSNSEKIKHYKSYYKNNMIQQLFRIYRDESIYDFHKVRVYCEKLTEMTFKINYFSDTINDIEMCLGGD